MRLIVAAIFVCVAFTYLLGASDNLHIVASIGIGIGICFITRLIYDESFIRTLRGISDEDYIESLVTSNQAAIEEFDVTEAITFDDLGTSCRCHILKIGRNRAICLYGQYLYDFAEIDDEDEPEINRPRSFPTSKFSIIRNLKSKEILDIKLGGVVINELFLKDIDVKTVYELGFKMEDGEILESISFSNLKEKLRNDS